MDRETLVIVMRSIPILLLSSGSLFLILKKKFNIILLGVLCLLGLEVLTTVTATGKLSDNISLLYLCGILYFILIYNLYEKLFFSIINKKVYHILLIVIVVIGCLFIYQGDPNLVFHYTATIEFLILLYPLSYFIKLAKQEIDYDLTNFILNSIIFIFFCLEIVSYIMLKFLIESALLSSIKITLFRYITIQLFYLSLIYFGWKIQKQ
jgi:hypothetical protein